MSGLALRAYGRTVGICGPDAVLRLTRERLPRGFRLTAAPAERVWGVDDRAGDRWLVLVDGVELSEHDDLTAATEAMLSDLELWIAERARRAVFLHAGCVVAEGRAIVVPGYSYSGKTSLIAALARAGAVYYSDEFAVLDHHGLVRPYSRPLSMRLGNGGSQRVRIEELGGRAGGGPAPVRLIAAVRYDADAGFAISQETYSRAALLLVRHAVPGRLRPRASLRAIQHAVADAVAVTGTRGDADRAAAALLEMLPA